jgi:VanZ family protein
MRAVRIILIVTLAAYWLTIFTITHMPPRNLPKLGVSDKVEHFVAYGVLGTLLYLTVWAFRPEFRFTWLLVIVVAMCYGAADEWLQLAVGRDCDFRDWLADTGGSIIAAVVLTFVRWGLWQRTIARQRDAWKVREQVKARLAGDAV